MTRALFSFVLMFGLTGRCAIGELVTATRATGYDLARIERELEIKDPNRNPYLNLAQWMQEAPEAPAALPADQVEAFYRAWATFWVNTQAAQGAWIRPVISPGENYRIGVWLWDSGFHVLGLRHGKAKARKLGLYQIEVMLSGQAADGRIPREIYVDGPRFLGEHGIQAPGILTLAANELLDAATDEEERQSVLKEIAIFYPRLVRNHRWYPSTVDQGRGLFKWQGWDSGWDNSPRWDTCFREAIDLNAWIYLDKTELARMAMNLGKTAEAQAWLAEASVFKKLIRKNMWSESQGIYNDTLCDGSIAKLLTPAIYFPVWVGIAGKAQAIRSFQYLVSPGHFSTPFPLPSVATSDLNFSATDFWRGPTWINLNWIVIQSLRRFGQMEKANQLAQKTLKLIARTPIPYEYYNPVDGSPLGSPSYGWSAALYVDLALLE